jgi:hypothetical protein
MKGLLLTAALLAQQPDRDAEREARLQEARVRALRKAHAEQPTSQAMRDAVAELAEASARLKQLNEEILISLLRRRRFDGERKTRLLQIVLRDYPDTPLGRLLRLGPRP